MTALDELGVSTEALTERGLLPDRRACVYVSGSLVKGWGNATSDVDVYVITEQPWDSSTAQTSAVAVTPGHVAVELRMVGQRRWDVEYWLDDQVDQVLRKVSWQELDDSLSAGKTLSADELDFLDRLGYARAVEGEDWLRARQAELNASPLRQTLAARSLNNADLYTEDAVGQLEAGDVHSAVLSAKLVLGYSVDALLASAGEVGQNAKWRARRFRAASQDVLSFDDYWRFETMLDYDDRRPQEWVEAVLAVAQRIAGEIEL